MLHPLLLVSLAALSSAIPPPVLPPAVTHHEDALIGLTMINEARNAAGLHNLIWDIPLADDAQSWATKMAKSEIPLGSSDYHYPVLGEAFYSELTATDCMGQSFSATLQSAAANWLHKWETEPSEMTKRNRGELLWIMRITCLTSTQIRA